MNEDDIIDFFTKGNRYYDRFDEKNWRQQMEEHPLLMTKPPDNPTDLPPLVEAFRQLKYSEESNTPQELANQYKLDGNENFKNKKFTDAEACYTKGLSYLDKITICEIGKDDDQSESIAELRSTLHSNKAACYMMLKDFLKAKSECQEALKSNPNNQRAIQRMKDITKKLSEE